MCLEVPWIKTEDLAKEATSFRVVLTRLSGFDLRQNAQCLIAVFVLVVLQDFVQGQFGTLVISQVELAFCHAKVSFEVLIVVLECKLVVFECVLKVELLVLGLAQYEGEIGLQQLNLLSERRLVGSFSFVFCLQNLQRRTAEIFAKGKLSFEEQML